MKKRPDLHHSMGINVAEVIAKSTPDPWDRPEIRKILTMLRKLAVEYQDGGLHPEDYLERRNDIVQDLMSKLL